MPSREPDRPEASPAGTGDGVLARAARRGDHEAFRSLYERYAPAVLGFLASRLGDHALAEDTLQEAFCRAYRALDAYDERRPFGPWIATIAENAATDQARRRARQARPVPPELASREALPDDVDPARVVTRREREDVLRAALTALPPDPRRVLILRYQRGLTQREVADQIGCSVRTAQSREEAALALLATLLDAQRSKARGPEREESP